MSKLIINVDDSMSDEDALKYISSVVGDGKVSGNGKAAQYCYHTAWPSGVHVSCMKTRTGSFSFSVYKE
jgi:hypothetical protein